MLYTFVADARSNNTAVAIESLKTPQRAARLCEDKLSWQVATILYVCKRSCTRTYQLIR